MYYLIDRSLATSEQREKLVLKVASFRYLYCKCFCRFQKKKKNVDFRLQRFTFLKFFLAFRAQHHRVPHMHYAKPACFQNYFYPQCMQSPLPQLELNCAPRTEHHTTLLQSNSFLTRRGIIAAPTLSAQRHAACRQARYLLRGTYLHIGQKMKQSVIICLPTHVRVF